MAVLFFYSNDSINEIVPIFYKALNITEIHECDSTHYLNDTYYEGSALGIRIQLAENNYDYEDDYNYMVAIKKSMGTTLLDESSLYKVAEIVASIITMEWNIKVAFELPYGERNDSLLIFSKQQDELIVENINYYDQPGKSALE